MTFRPSHEDDYLGSYLRRHVLYHLLRQELKFDTILGQDYDTKPKVLLTDDDNPLYDWQDDDASHHWQCKFNINLRSISLSKPALRSIGYPHTV